MFGRVKVLALAMTVVTLLSTAAEAQLNEIFGTRYRNAASKIESLEHVPGTALKLHRPEATLEVRFTRADKGEVLVHARVRAAEPQTLDEIEVVTTRAEDGLLTIEVTGPTTEEAKWVVERIDVTMPRVSGIDIETRSGDILVRGMRLVDPATPRRLPPAPTLGPNGRVLFGSWFEGLGASSIVTDSGKVELTASAGALKIESDAGDVKLIGHEGALSVTTAVGSVEATGLSAPFSIWTRSGAVDVRVKPMFEGPVGTYSTGGKVYVAAGVPVGGDADAGPVPSSVTTSNGPITVELE